MKKQKKAIGQVHRWSYGPLVLRAIGPTGYWSYGSLVLRAISPTTGDNLSGQLNQCWVDVEPTS